MNFHRMDTRVSFLRIATVAGAIAEQVETVKTIVKAWCEVVKEPRNGEEETIRIKVRYQKKLAGLTVNDRFLFKNRTYDITSAVPAPVGRPVEIEITGTASNNL